ncbi:hypothetical protein BD626DRAFT_497942 [Schizophyllum amplum]|uniref:JmjC domain-containing protein n=1 Tax=Schizophyllum amplum TaxID=97359 RepID=A0A550CCU6_9AGAR|nr:hypothetical protein BD626DRAFT_497942 [Auriculariopsis ampla]
MADTLVIERRTKDTPYDASHILRTKDWSYDTLVSSGFHPATRVHCESDLTAALNEYRKSETPLVIHGWHQTDAWDRDLLSLHGFAQHVELPDNLIEARNVHTWTDSTLPLDDFVAKCRSAGPTVGDGEKERLYGKDAPCPPAWTEWLHRRSTIPQEVLPDSETNILNALPPAARVEHLMCYLGVGDTFTPMHKDLCASYGQNLMTYTEKGGSSYWFMTRGGDAQRDLRRAPFHVYIIEQKLGDMVFVPPRSAHQVVNSGGITVKMSWSRMEPRSLQVALYNELPIYRRVGRRETYKVKALIHYLLVRNMELLENIVAAERRANLSQSSIFDELMLLVGLYEHLLVDEYTKKHDTMAHLVSKDAFQHFDDLLCDFCGADIYQSFFRCAGCAVEADAVGGKMDDCVSICAACYVEGRVCLCEGMNLCSIGIYDAHHVERTVVEGLGQFFLLYRLPEGQLARENTGTLLQSNFDATFDAAYGLWTARQKPPRKPTMMCRPGRGGPSHEVPRLAGLRCEPCHSARCYLHILQATSIHIIQAFATFQGGRQAWHEHHLSCRSNAQQAFDDFSDAQEKGCRPKDLNAMRAAVAAAFTDCRPLKPKAVKLGFYDSGTGVLVDEVSDTDSSTIDTIAGSSDTSVDSGFLAPKAARLKKPRHNVLRSCSPDGHTVDDMPSGASSVECVPPIQNSRHPPPAPKRMVLDCMPSRSSSPSSSSSQPPSPHRPHPPAKNILPTAQTSNASPGRDNDLKLCRVPKRVFRASQGARAPLSEPRQGSPPRKKHRLRNGDMHPRNAVLSVHAKKRGLLPALKTKAHEQPQRSSKTQAEVNGASAYKPASVPEGLHFKRITSQSTLGGTSGGSAQELAAGEVVPLPPPGWGPSGQPIAASSSSKPGRLNYEQGTWVTPSTCAPTTRSDERTSTDGHAPRSFTGAPLAETYGKVELSQEEFDRMRRRICDLERLAGISHNDPVPTQLPVRSQYPPPLPRGNQRETATSYPAPAGGTSGQQGTWPYWPPNNAVLPPHTAGPVSRPPQVYSYRDVHVAHNGRGAPYGGVGYGPSRRGGFGS